MRISSVDQSSKMPGTGIRDAESLFRSKPVSEIRNVEVQTRKEIDNKKVELRQLIGNRYRDLIESADSILLMKSSCESISSNITSINDTLFSLSDSSKNTDFSPNLNRNRVRIYGIASRVKYLVDTPENIWGCLDEFMFLEASSRYIRAKLVYEGLNFAGDDLRKNFPLLNHQWQIVESFKGQISQRSREKLMVLEKREGYDVLKVEIGAFADALAGVAIIDELDATQAFGLFLESRKGWILQRLNGFFDVGNVDVVSVLCEVTKIIQVTIAQVGELFLQVLNDLPLFYKVILGSPPASQLFGGIPNPDEEERLWNEFREKLESVMVILDRDFVAKSCCSWLRECGREIVKKVDGRSLIDSIANGAELASAEKLVQETMDCKDVLEGSLEWLKSVFGSDIELPWSRTRELVLEESVDLWDEIFEDAFVSRMKLIIDSGFKDLARTVNVPASLQSVGSNFTEQCDFRAYLRRSSVDGGVWFIDSNVKNAGFIPSIKTSPEEFDFSSCISAYFGPEASRIRDALDNCCHSVLQDLLSFLDSPKASLRLNHLAPYLQSKCYESTSTILTDLKNELDKIRASLENGSSGTESEPQAAIIEKSLFIGRLLFAFQNHSKHVPMVLGPPRYWVNDTLVSGSGILPNFSGQSKFSLDSVTPDSPGKQFLGNARRQSLVANALFGASDNASPKLEEVINSIKNLCIAAYGLWISWVSDGLANILSEDLRLDDGLSSTTPLRGWEEVVVKQDGSGGSDSEMKLLLPSLPSLYIASFLFRACEEIHRVGGHVLDKVILQRFAKRLLEKVIDIYTDLATNGAELSDKGVLQALLDLRFAADILSGCDSSVNEDLSKSPYSKSAFRRKQEKNRSKSAIRERVDDLVNRISQKLDPVDWQTFEPYLWENERQSYLRHAVLFGFFVQLNRLYTDTVQKLPTNAESNIMRCSKVPRFKYLPISAPALSSRATVKAPIRTFSDDVSSRSSMKNGDFSQNIDFDDNSSFGAATPFLKSFMQVGSRFGEGTFKLGSILNDARFKDKATAMSSFGDILPVQAAGLLSSFTATRSDS